MSYKIELRYIYGWDDAGWTTSGDEGEEDKPWRFKTVEEAQAALEEFFANVKEAIAAGNMDSEENLADYRIVATIEKE